MIDVEKIKIMTKLATYEKGKGKRDIAMNRYAREDYIKYRMLWSSIIATVAFGIACFFILLWGLDWFVSLSSGMAYLMLIVAVCMIYVIFLFVYRKFLRKFYNKLYTQMTLRVEKYRKNLAILKKMYEQSEKAGSAIVDLSQEDSQFDEW